MSLLRVQQLLQDQGDHAVARQVGRVAAQTADDRCHVVVFGDFNRGKSTLINALLGRPLLQAKLVPTTGHVTRVVAGSPEQLVVQFRDGRTQAVALDRLNEIATLDADGRVREDVELLTVTVAAGLLSAGLVVTDTPGRNEDARQSDRTALALLSADAVVWLLDARQCLHEREREMTTAWLADRPGVPLLPVVNFMNLLEEEDRVIVRDRLNAWGADSPPESTAVPRGAVGRCYFEVNARGALLAATADGPPPADDFARLAAELRRLAGPDHVEHRRRSRAAQVGAVLGPVRDENRRRLDVLTAEQDATDRDREARRHAIRHSQAALDANARTQRQMLTPAATSVLSQKLQAVQREFANRTAAQLQQSADDWYATHLRAAVVAVMSLADTALAELAGLTRLAAPACVSLARSLPAPSRLAVSLPPPPDEDEDDARDDAPDDAGGDTRAGRRADRRAARVERRTERRAERMERQAERRATRPAAAVDHVQLYQARAAENWASAQATVLAELGRQFDAGVGRLAAQSQERLAAIDGEPDDPARSAEAARRAELERLIGPLVSSPRT